MSVLRKAHSFFTGKTITIPQRPKGLNSLHVEKGYDSHQELLIALEDVSRVLGLEVELKEILEDMATIVAKAIGAKWVNFWELTPDRKSTYISAAYGMKKSYIDQSRESPIQLGRAWIGRAIKTGKAWGTSDILTDPHLMKDLGQHWKEAIEKQDYRALLCVPTVGRRGVVGGMCVYYPTIHEFSDFEMRLVTIAANQAATSIVNSQILGDLMAEKNKTLAMVNSLSDGIMMYDLKGRIIAFNPKAEELFWVAAGEILGKLPSELEMKKTSSFANIMRISSLPIADFENKEMSFEDPQKFVLVVTQLPVRNSKNENLGSLRVLHDITKEKESDELKHNFVTVASHQLRTPLAGIKWAIAELNNQEYGPLTEKQKDILDKAYVTTSSVIALVHDLLDTSRIEEGKFGYEFHAISVDQVLQEMQESIAAVREGYPAVSFRVEKLSKNFPPLLVDMKKLKMALYNVLENAFKYTPKGDVFLQVIFQNGIVSFTVKDEGIGIPKDQQKYIFTKFFRARNAILIQTEGSGLGLWIANEIIKKHNGSIAFESIEKKGSVFTIELPAK